MAKLAGTTWKPAPRHKKTAQGGRKVFHQDVFHEQEHEAWLQA
jgi:hypothetical protein